MLVTKEFLPDMLVVKLAVQMSFQATTSFVGERDPTDPTTPKDELYGWPIGQTLEKCLKWEVQHQMMFPSVAKRGT